MAQPQLARQTPLLFEVAWLETKIYTALLNGRYTSSTQDSKINVGV